MSLDVYLTLEGETGNPGTGIFVRENGQISEVTWEEWQERFPGRIPYLAFEEPDIHDGCVYRASITHNLNRMAEEAGLYLHVWEPERVGVETAGQMVEPLRTGIETLESRPDHFKQFNPSNGWGDYNGFVRFLKYYLDACEKYPSAKVEARG